MKPTALASGAGKLRPFPSDDGLSVRGREREGKKEERKRSRSLVLHHLPSRASRCAKKWRRRGDAAPPNPTASSDMNSRRKKKEGKKGKEKKNHHQLSLSRCP